MSKNNVFFTLFALAPTLLNAQDACYSCCEGLADEHVLDMDDFLQQCHQGCDDLPCDSNDACGIGAAFSAGDAVSLAEITGGDGSVLCNDDGTVSFSPGTESSQDDLDEEIPEGQGLEPTNSFRDFFYNETYLFSVIAGVSFIMMLIIFFAFVYEPESELGATEIKPSKNRKNTLDFDFDAFRINEAQWVRKKNVMNNDDYEVELLKKKEWRLPDEALVQNKALYKRAQKKLEREQRMRPAGNVYDEVKYEIDPATLERAEKKRKRKTAIESIHSFDVYENDPNAGGEWALISKDEEALARLERRTQISKLDLE